MNRGRVPPDEDVFKAGWDGNSMPRPSHKNGKLWLPDGDHFDDDDDDDDDEDDDDDDGDDEDNFVCVLVFIIIRDYNHRTSPKQSC